MHYQLFSHSQIQSLYPTIKFETFNDDMIFKYEESFEYISFEYLHPIKINVKLSNIPEKNIVVPDILYSKLINLLGDQQIYHLETFYFEDTEMSDNEYTYKYIYIISNYGNLYYFQLNMLNNHQILCSLETIINDNTSIKPINYLNFISYYANTKLNKLVDIGITAVGNGLAICPIEIYDLFNDTNLVLSFLKSYINNHITDENTNKFYELLPSNKYECVIHNNSFFVKYPTDNHISKIDMISIANNTITLPKIIKDNLSSILNNQKIIYTKIEHHDSFDRSDDFINGDYMFKYIYLVTDYANIYNLHIKIINKNILKIDLNYYSYNEHTYTLNIIPQDYMDDYNGYECSENIHYKTTHSDSDSDNSSDSQDSNHIESDNNSNDDTPTLKIIDDIEFEEISDEDHSDEKHTDEKHSDEKHSNEEQSDDIQLEIASNMTHIFLSKDTSINFTQNINTNKLDKKITNSIQLFLDNNYIYHIESDEDDEGNIYSLEYGGYSVEIETCITMFYNNMKTFNNIIKNLE
jgi:hypothetical protein